MSSSIDHNDNKMRAQIAEQIKNVFDNTNRINSTTILGSCSMGNADQSMAEYVLEIILKHGDNHIVIASSYGDEEIRAGSRKKQATEEGAIQ